MNKEARMKLFLLIGEMVLMNLALAVTRIPGFKTVQDLLNFQINTLKNIYRDLKKQISAEEGDDDFGISRSQTNRINQLNKWKELIYLLVLYLEDKEEKTKLKAKKADLKTKYAEAEAAAMTPKEIMEKLKAEIDALEETEED